MAEYSKHWEDDEVIKSLELGWNTKKDVAKDAVKEWIRDNVSSSDTFLDVGCGTGFFAPAASGVCGTENYLGVDATIMMIDACRDKYPDLKFQCGNILDLSDIADDSFDIVISCDVIMHIPVCVPAIKELYRVAKKKILIKTPLTNRPEGQGVPVKGEENFNRVYWIGYNRDKFMDMVKEATTDRDKVTIYDDIKVIKSRSKKECYWALIEIIKEDN